MTCSGKIRVVSDVFNLCVKPSLSQAAPKSVLSVTAAGLGLTSIALSPSAASAAIEQV
jgi:hypothetical protein